MPVKDARSALMHALEGALPVHTVKFVNLHSAPWASGSFSGALHRVEMLVSGPGAAADLGTFLEGLNDREFDLGRFILADISANCTPAENGAVRLTVEALTTDND